MSNLVLKHRRDGSVYFAPKSNFKLLFISLFLLTITIYSVNMQSLGNTEQPTIAQRIIKHVPRLPRTNVDTTGIMVEWVMKHNVPKPLAEDIVNHAVYQGAKQGVDPKLILSLIKVESTFKPTAISGSNALGLMQVILVWHKEKLHDYKVFDTGINIELGTRVLKEYMRGTNVTTALLKYNGALSNPNDYPSKILNTKKNLEQFINSRV